MQLVSRSNARYLCLVLTPYSIRNVRTRQRPHWITEFFVGVEKFESPLLAPFFDMNRLLKFLLLVNADRILYSCSHRPGYPMVA